MGDNSWIVNPGTGRVMERSMQRYRIYRIRLCACSTTTRSLKRIVFLFARIKRYEAGVTSLVTR